MSASRAYLDGGRLGEGLEMLSAETARIAGVFAAAGAMPVEPAALQPASLLLDLYGEDVRARAYIVTDPVEGELILRPDFTAPVVRLHMQAGASPARYHYCGPVYRQQAPGSARPTEYLQAGVEFLGEPDPIAADADLFALIRAALGDQPTRAVIGDLGVAFAAIAGLTAPERWKAQLRRHLWRPRRFRQVLEGHGAAETPSLTRAALLAAPDLAAHIRAAGPEQGRRSAAEVAARARELAEDAATPPIPAEEIQRIEAILETAGPAPEAVARLRDLAAGAAGLTAALDRVDRRLEALEKHGETAADLRFDASFGRSLEYYDGFVFEFSAPAAPHLPPVAGGGRYDALTKRLGKGQALPAVGGILRPEALIAARGGV
jgi:ATP phosphoribosyltransferase regulatory subunit